MQTGGCWTRVPAQCVSSVDGPSTELSFWTMELQGSTFSLTKVKASHLPRIQVKLVPLRWCQSSLTSPSAVWSWFLRLPIVTSQGALIYAAVDGGDGEVLPCGHWKSFRVQGFIPLDSW